MQTAACSDCLLQEKLDAALVEAQHAKHLERKVGRALSAASVSLAVFRIPAARPVA